MARILRGLRYVHDHGTTNLTCILRRQACLTTKHAWISSVPQKQWEGMLFSGKEPSRLIREQFQHLIGQGIAPTHRAMVSCLSVLPLIISAVRQQH
jgi:hypothetical protein